MYFMDLAEHNIKQCFHELHDNCDDSMLAAADAALKYSATLPNDPFIIPESSPNAKGSGRTPTQDGIKQFPGEGRKPDAVEDTDGNGMTEDSSRAVETSM